MADSRLSRLLERGLRHFALGEVDHAVACWREVLAVDPENRRAQEYLELVASVMPPGEDVDTLGAGFGLESSPSQGESAPAAAHESPRADVPERRGGGEGAKTALAAGDERGAEPEEVVSAPPRPQASRERPKPSTGSAPSEPDDEVDAWFDPEPGGTGSHGGAGGLPWQEWHSEIDLGASSEFFFDDREAPESTPSPASGDAPRSEIEAAPATPGAAPTGWDLAAGGAALQVRDDLAGDALDLLGDTAAAPVAVPEAVVGQQTPGPNARADADTLMAGARELFELGDFSGSLELVQKALEVEPGHAEALAYLERNQETLVQIYESKVGPLDSRPRVVLRPDEIVWLNLDHRAGFVLAQIDGTVTIDDLYALSGLSRLDTAKILAELVEQGVIAS